MRAPPSGRQAADVAIRCLLVDDNDRFLGVARAVLEREGIVVSGVASTIAEALAQTERLCPDVALIDVDLGGESGFDLVERLAELPPSWRPSTILTSSYAEADFADVIASCPAAGFVTKPELSGSAIEQVLGAAGDGPAGGG
ncbi:response regulator [Spirillospora sp. CA-128828]|uniref:response regulator n=1 Tax=Spirillospora sp. CA-128828 TaxID=3240033 RepID=UPI003D8E03DC